MSPSYAIFPKRNIIYNNLQPYEVQSIEDIQVNSCGYIGYECYTHIEEIAPPPLSFCTMPPLHFSKITEQSSFDISAHKMKAIPQIKWIKSNLNKQRYMQGVQSIIQHIKAGDCYQVNLTRKFYGEFEYAPNPLDIFAKLYGISPNPYSMLYVFNGNRAVASSSPECFLTRKNNEIFSTPIKGSLNSQYDISQLNNFKDKSENLMITDLVRNDIGKVTRKVWVENFQHTQTFSQVHHMSSKICGDLNTGVSNAECFKATFPAGSMTGTPKIKAIQIANKLEGIQRGIYSGCLGVVDDDSQFDFGVVIRTIILDGKNFEFQIGGAVVFDSTPQGEFYETIIKAQPILQTLNINEDIFYE